MQLCLISIKVSKYTGETGHDIDKRVDYGRSNIWLSSEIYIDFLI